VEAITLSMSRFTIGEVSIRFACFAVLTATMVNTLTKPALVTIIGSSKTGAHVAWPMIWMFVDRRGSGVVAGLLAVDV
jgi:uncharacterized membrane protein (DUF4010 family)